MRYSQEDKERALALVAQSNARKASEQLNIPYNTVLRWANKASEDTPIDEPAETEPMLQSTSQQTVTSDMSSEASAGPANAPAPITAEEQVRALERQNADLIETVQRLKNAISALIA